MLSIKTLRLISNLNSSIRSQHTNAEENGDLTIENQEKEGKNLVSCFDFGDSETEEVDVFEDDPSQWIIDCEEDDNCPSKWECHNNYCYPPAPLPSFYRYLTPVRNDTVVKYKVGLINCTRNECNCLEGYKCEDGKCIEKESPEFASGGVTPETVAQVGGVSRLRIKTLVDNTKTCICPPHSSYDEEACYNIKCNHKNRCWCDYNY